MRQLIYFAIAALVIAGIMPRVMSHVGQNASAETQPAKRAEPAPARQANNYRTVTVQSDRLGHFQVEGSVDGRRVDFMVDTGASVVATLRMELKTVCIVGLVPSMPSNVSGVTCCLSVRYSRSRPAT